MAATIKLSKLKPNPKNPRLIKDDKFLKLLRNILSYPKFLRERPIVQKGHIIGGNMRYKTIEHIVKLTDELFNGLVTEYNVNPEAVTVWQQVRKTKSIPSEWVADAKDYTDEQVDAFIILDNVEFGENDWEMLANEWNTVDLDNWGVEGLEQFTASKEKKIVQFEVGGEKDVFSLLITCDSEKHCQQLYEKFNKEGLQVKIVT